MTTFASGAAAGSQALAPAAVDVSRRDDGSQILRSPQPLAPYARCVGEWLEFWSARTPEAPALRERDPGGGWRRLNWRQVRESVGRLAQGLLARRLPADAPVVILSDNSVDHALLMLACLHVGRPVCSVSSAYSRMGAGHARLRAMLDALQPALVYASDAQAYGQACEVARPQALRVFGRGADGVAGALAWQDLHDTPEGPEVAQAFEAVGPDSHAKYLLTSGSTGRPKVVINTQRMLCANQQMLRQVWRFLEWEKPVLVDWLPWSHTFGGNHNFNMVLCHGGELVVDEGRPAPGLIEHTLRNLAEVQPTLLFNVPRGLDMLTPLLEADEARAAQVLARLRAVFYAGAALTPATWERLQALAQRVTGQPLWLTTAWGSTETAPAVTSAHWGLDGPGVIGLPLPGVELKLVDAGAKTELRVRGPNVFPGYRDDPERTREAFDAEGFYRIGDAGRWADPARPEAGIVFDGRLAEDFKLGSGSWVSVGTLRVAWLSALAPLAQDLVVTGHGRDELGMLIFPSISGAALGADEQRARVEAAMQALREQGHGSSTWPTRALVLAEPPSVEAGEITDKGYLNQAAVLSRRQGEVERLYGGDPAVIRPVAAA